MPRVRTALLKCSNTDRRQDCLNRAAFDHQLTEDISQYQASHNSSDEYVYGHGMDSHETAMDHPCLELRKMLSGGTFYYSTDFDLTNRLQDR